MPREAPPAPAAKSWARRRLNMRELVGAFDPNAEHPWLLKPLVIPGTLAIVVGQGGSGKTWVMHEACHAVATASDRAGLQGRSAPARAMIIDAEMGEWLTVQRFAQQGYSLDIEVIDATGMNLMTPEHRAELWDMIVTLAPDFIGWDSLSALTSGADENGKETGDLLNWVRNVHQTAPTNPAGMMIHHAGWKEERTRGSSTIRDRVDAVWYFKQSQDDDSVRELSCHGAQLKAPRWSRPPAPLYMRLREEGGLVAAERPKPVAEVQAETQESALRAAVMAGKVASQADAAEVLGLSRNGNNAKVGALLKRIHAVRVDKAYVIQNGHGDGPDV